MSIGRPHANTFHLQEYRGRVGGQGVEGRGWEQGAKASVGAGVESCSKQECLTAWRVVWHKGGPHGWGAVPSATLLGTSSSRQSLPRPTLCPTTPLLALLPHTLPYYPLACPTSPHSALLPPCLPYFPTLCPTPPCLPYFPTLCPTPPCLPGDVAVETVGSCCPEIGVGAELRHLHHGEADHADHRGSIVGSAEPACIQAGWGMCGVVESERYWHLHTVHYLCTGSM